VSDTPDFKSFAKIGRLRRNVIITEKIDGTNACVYVGPDGEVLAGSRNRWITPGKGMDNHGFAVWVEAHRERLRAGLGVGYHYGEWWGQGIARGYGLREKRWSLFNPKHYVFAMECLAYGVSVRTVPVLGQGLLDSDVCYDAMYRLRIEGSVAAPGYMNPEGIVIFHTATGTLFKVTLEHDEAPKGSTEAA